MGKPYFIHEAAKFWYHPVIHKLNWLALLVIAITATALFPQVYDRFMTASLGFLFIGFGLLAISMIGPKKSKQKTNTLHSTESQPADDFWSQIDSDPRLQSAVKKYALSMMAQK